MSSEVKSIASQKNIHVPLEAPRGDKDPSKIEKVVGRNIKKDNFSGLSERNSKHLRPTCDYPDCTKTLRLVDSMLAYKRETYCQKHRFQMMKWIMSDEQTKKK